MKKFKMALICLAVIAMTFQTMSFTAFAAENVEAPTAWGPVPDESQKAYHEEELAAFIHFGVNTFTGKEWGTGKESPNVFNPTDLDTDQWVRTVKEAGFKRIIMIGRHHDGFCLWKSEYTDHDVDNSTNWQTSQGGDGDVILELSKSCTKYDMDMGLYLSPWDANNSSYGYGSGSDDATDSNADYNEYYMNQLREILGNPQYGNNGKFVEVWMDGAKGEGAAAQKYKFDEWFDLIEELQPGALVFSPYGSTIRWVGNEKGEAGDPCWSKISEQRLRSAYDAGYEEAKYLNSGDANGDIWSIAEADVSIKSGWFWHEGNKPKTMEELSKIYFESVGHGQPLLLNIPPDNRGKFTDDDVNRVTEFGNAIKNTFKTDLTKKAGVSASASSIREGSDKFDASKVLDDDTDTYWTMDDQQTTGSLTIDLADYTYFDIVSIEEYITLGQRISDFNVEVHTKNGWQEFDNGHTIGAKRLARNIPVSADKIRINITGSQAVPLIENVGVYKADQAFEMPRIIPDDLKTIDNTELGNADSWTHETLGDNNTSMYATTTNTYATASFHGTKAWIYGTTDPGHGIMEVWIDDKKVADVDTYRSTRTLPALLYTTDDLENTNHTLKMVVKGQKNASSKGNAVGLDFIAYLDNNGAGMFEMLEDAYVVNEGDSQDVTIQRIGGTSGEVSIHFATTPDTAVHGRHYKDTNKTITFVDGQSNATVSVETIDNSEISDNLRFFTQIDTPSNGAILGLRTSSSITIKDNDYNGSLDEAIKEANDKNEGHYTTASWVEFAAAYANAIAVKNDPSSTQEQITIAKNELIRTMNALQPRTTYTISDPFIMPTSTNVSKLLEAEFFTLVPTTPLDKHVRVEDVSSASNGKMVTWFENGDVIKIPYTAEKAGTYTITATFCSGRNESNPNTFNWSGAFVKNGTVSVYGPNASVYKTISFDVEITKAGAGELIFTANSSGCPNVDKFEITAKEFSLDQELRNYIAICEGVVEANYTQASYADLQVQIKKANELLENTPTIDEIKTALATLKTTHDALVSVVDLKAAIVAGEEINSLLYTSESYERLSNAITDAKKELINGTDASVEAAKQRIEESIDQLVKLDEEINTAVLDFILAVSEDAIERKAEYDTEAASWDIFEKAYAAAKKAKEDLISQDAVNEAAKALANAYEDIRLLPTEDISSYVKELRDYIAICEGVVEADYTKVSYADLQDEITKANELLDNAPTIAEIKTALANLKTAHDALVSVVELKAAIAAGEEIDPALYTSESYEQLSKALMEAKKELIDGTDASVEAAKQRIEESIDQLVKLDEEINTAVLDFILAVSEDAIERKAEYDTEAASWDIFEKAYAAAKKAKEDLISQDAVDEAAKALANAYEDIRLLPTEDISSYVKELRDYIAICEGVVEADYTKVSYADLQDEITKANELLDNAPTIAEIKTALATLKTTHEALVSIVELKAAIAAGEEIDPALYTSDSYERLSNAIKDAKKELINGTDASVEAANLRIKESIDQLVKLDEEINTAVLDFILAVSEDAIARKAEYDTEAASWDIFEKAYAAAKKAKEDLISQDAVDEAAKALASAYEDIRLLPTEDISSYVKELREYIAKCEGVVEADYTKVSYADLQDEITKANELLDNAPTIAEIKTALANLKIAHDALVSVVDLKAAIVAGEEINSLLYTSESYERLSNAITDAKKELINGTDASVEAAKLRIEESIDQLVKIDKEINTAVLDFILAVSEDAIERKAEYDTEAASWDIFEKAYAAAKKAKEDLISQDAVDEAAKVLANAYEDIRLLANEDIASYVKELRDYIAICEGAVEADYTQLSFTDLQVQIKKANELLENTPTIDEIKTALATLKTTHDALVSVVDLKAAIIAGEEIDPALYTSDSYERLSNAITDAKKELINGTDASVEAAKQRIEESIAQLVKIDEEINTAVLDFVLAMGDEAIARKDYYDVDASSWDIFEKAYAAAKKAKEELTSQDAVDEAAKVLANAYEDIRLIANETTLNELRGYIGEINRIDMAAYAKEDVTLFELVKARIEAMVSSGSYTFKEYKTIIKDMDKIKERIAEGKKPEEKPVEISKDKTLHTVKPETQQVKKSSTKPNENAIDTGDHNHSGLYMSMMLIAMCAIWFSMKKKTSDN